MELFTRKEIMAHAPGWLGEELGSGREVEAAAFIAAICREPFEDSHRLVYADWLEEHGHGERAAFIRRQVLEVPDEELRVLYHGGEAEGFLIRGFVGKVQCDLETWRLIGEGLVKEQPVTRVAVTDRSPSENLMDENLAVYEWEFGEDQYQWGEQEPHWVDWELQEFVPPGPNTTWCPRGYYPSEKCAAEALSRGLVNMARSHAGLPALEWPPLTGED